MRVLTAIAVAAAVIVSGSSAEREQSRYTPLVDPFIGTGGHGHTYPGAMLPFGGVQLSPDTRLSGWDGCSCYHYSDSLIHGFSHTHLSGTGASDYGDILFMPTTGPVRLESCGEGGVRPGYCSRFRHENEAASPGYYRVLLDDYDVTVELTVTRRAGFHRYTFPKSDRANVVIDLAHRDKVVESSITFVNETEIEGCRRSAHWADDQYIYFAARFSKPFKAHSVAVDGALREGANEAAGTDIKACVSFDTKKDEQVLVKVGISAVSAKGAWKNLDREIKGWDFERVRLLADADWERSLGKIHIEGGSEAEMRKFYTALYHTMLAPNLFMDVDGQYRGMDKKIHLARDFEYYTVFSLWDTYRAEHPLFTIIEPERTVDFIKTFLAQYEDGGLLPVWELAANETWCMIGYHAVPVIVDAYVKGIRGFDADTALEAMKRSAMRDDPGLACYRELGYIPSDCDGESVSKTLEYAYDDWCIAQMARQLGDRGDYRTYLERAQSYKNLFDPATGFMRARVNGGWYEPFDPAESNFNYTEANAWQYSFAVPQDIRTLISLMGGAKRFSAKLDKLFMARSEVPGLGQPDISGLIGQYAHGNEPSHHMAYLYCYAGQPWKTQERVRQIMATLYGTGPEGLCGNEDCGQMSAWYVLSALGLYPVTPGSDVYVIGSPVFPRAVIDLPAGRRFEIKAIGASATDRYVQSAMLNGKPHSKTYIRHEDIVRGGSLVFEMGFEKNMRWGSGEGDAPPSAIAEHLITPVPFVEGGARAFADSLVLFLDCALRGARMHYSLDGTEPTPASRLCLAPVTIREPATLKAIAIREGLAPSRVMTASFRKVAAGRRISLGTRYSPMYAGGGDIALIDGIRGAENFRTGTWQGYQGVDLDAIVDLGAVQPVRRVAAGFLQDQRSWILMPREVEFEISKDGAAFTVLGTVVNEVAQDAGGAIIRDFSKDGLNVEARYVRVRAINSGTLPAWHGGSGKPAWIFCDEIVIE